jgi:hypothetical protein
MERKSLEEIFGTQPKRKSLDEIFAVEAPVEEATVVEAPQGQSGLDAATGAIANFDKGATFGFGRKLGGLMNAIGAAPVDALLTDKSLGQAFKDRYDEINQEGLQQAEKFAEENPVSAFGLNLAGSAVNPVNKLGVGYIAKGAGLGSKIARGAGVGAVTGELNALGNDGDVVSDVLLGAGVGGALPIAGSAIKGTAKGLGNVVSKILGKTTGAGDKAIEDAFKAGQKGNTVFRDKMRKPDDIDEVVGKAMKSLDKIKQARGRAYDEGISVLRRDTTKLDIDPVIRDTKRIINAEGGGSEYLVDDDTSRVLTKAKDILNKFYKDKPRHNTAGFDDLKKAIGNIKTTPDTNAERVKTEIANSVRTQIMKQNPSYKKVMDDYARDSANIDTLKRTFSLDNRANLETTLRKLQSVTRNNANTDYGYRAELLKKIDPTGEIYDAVSSNALNSWTPRGLVGGGVAGAGLATVNPALLATSSPRLVGEAAYILGKGASKLPQKEITPYLVQFLTGD